jgi:hypothetical protein
MEFFIIVPSNLCSNAESELNKYFETNKLKFEFNDGSKDHNELIIVKPGTERTHIRDQYISLVRCFPSESNEIIKQMTEIKMNHDQKLLQVETEIELLKANHKNELLQSNHKNELLESELNKKDLTHEIEILKLRLEMSKLK